MKNIILSLIISITCFAGLSAAEIASFTWGHSEQMSSAELSQYTIVNANGISEEALEEIFSGKGVDSKTIVEFSAGTTFPLRLNFQGDVINITHMTPPFGAPANIEVKRDFYMRSAYGTIMLSLDGTIWEDAVSFFYGNFSIDAKRKASNLLEFTLNGTLNKS